MPDPFSQKTKKSIVSYVLTALIVIAIGFYVKRNIAEIREYDFLFNWIFVFAGFIAAVSALLMMLLNWQFLTRSFGLHAPPIRAGKAFFLSQLGKYIPGKVGLVLVRLDAYRGYSRKTVALATGVEYIASFTSACVMVLIGTLLMDIPLPPYVRWLALSLLVLLLAMLFPPILKWSSNRFFRLIKRDPIDEFPTYSKMLSFVGMYVIVGLLYGLSLFLVLNSLSPVGIEHFFAVTGTFWAAALIGIAAIFAPSGIGVREGVLLLVLPAFIPEPTVIVGTIISRLVFTAAELTLAGVFAGAEKWTKDDK